MKVTISLDFDEIKGELQDAFVARLDDLGYTPEQIKALEESFFENIDGGYMDATFEVEMNEDESEVTSCILVGN